MALHYFTAFATKTGQPGRAGVLFKRGARRAGGDRRERTDVAQNRACDRGLHLALRRHGLQREPAPCALVLSLRA